jgi:hypothetical protein
LNAQIAEISLGLMGAVEATATPHTPLRAEVLITTRSGARIFLRSLRGTILA